jgi:ribosomal protein S18 acetylase RimI-like enzyme
VAPDDHTIELLDPATQLEQLRPLWLAMVAHHHAITPDWGPVRDDDDSWSRRHKDYAGWLTEPDAFCLVARDGDGRAVGYLLATVNSGSPTWAAVERFAYIESVSVLPELRGAGIGKRLLDAASEHLDELGVSRIELTAVARNAEALRFYEREGFSVSFVQLTRD